MKTWTFGRRMAMGFAVTVSFVLVVGVIAVAALRVVATGKDRVIDGSVGNLLLAEKLRTSAHEKGAQVRGYLLTEDEGFLARLSAVDGEMNETLAEVQGSVENPEGRRLMTAVATAAEEYERAVRGLTELRRREADLGVVEEQFRRELAPSFKSLSGAIDAYVKHERSQLRVAQAAASKVARDTELLLAALAILALLVASGLAWWLTRTLGRQIGEAVQRVRSSSTELEAAASQQASAAREQAVATKEVGTTMDELRVSSRQIADSAKRVAKVAGETADAGRRGTQTVDQAQTSIGAIKEQVDEIASHMLALGHKSQQIGGILEIINELAEQTNILAINATIEAAGAGESGRRFGVVGAEIRGLADRVGESTKRIRSLIEEIRGAVNTTVMATEAGAKQVDAGAQSFDEVAVAFRSIAELVETTTDAAAEIELSTKQQASAVEQVSESLQGVSQASAETEVGSKQTLDTASELTELSGQLGRLVQTSR